MDFTLLKQIDVAFKENIKLSNTQKECEYNQEEKVVRKIEREWQKENTRRDKNKYLDIFHTYKDLTQVLISFFNRKKTCLTSRNVIK